MWVRPDSGRTEVVLKNPKYGTKVTENKASGNSKLRLCDLAQVPHPPLMTLSQALKKECRKGQGEQTRMPSTSLRQGLKCGGYNVKANERYCSKWISLAQGGRGH